MKSVHEKEKAHPAAATAGQAMTGFGRTGIRPVHDYTTNDTKGRAVKRLSDGQKRRVVQLIRRECCNLYEGSCLLLDDGEPVPCPQMMTNSLLCRYFRSAVLPIDKALEAEIMGHDGVKTCQVCGRPFRAVSNRAKYCEACSRTVRKKQKAAWQRENRG